MLGHELVGRERELGLLADELERAASDVGGAVLVSGIPGIGKTRLASELAGIAAARGFGVHWGRCWQGHMAPAFWPWVQVLRSMQARDTPTVPALAKLLDLIAPSDGADREAGVGGPGDGFVVVDQLAGALSAAAAAGPMLVVIDDLQWADASSLQAFAHVATTASASRLLVVATIRAGDEARRPELAAMTHVVPRIDLGRLNDDDVAVLLASTLGEPPTAALLDRVRSACAGNPFYVTALAETARHSSSDDVPASVRAAVLAQVEPLGVETRSVLTGAAVIGREFSIEDVASLIDLDVATVLDTIAAAERVGLVRVQSYGSRYSFVHDLVREAIYGSLPTRDRTMLHHRAAGMLSNHDDDFYVATRAHHALAALPLGRAEDAVALARSAGDQANARHALVEAARWYRRAHDVAVSGQLADPRVRAGLLFAEGSSLRGVQSPAADGVLAEAASVASALGDAELLGRVAVAWTYRHGGAGLQGVDQRRWVLRAVELLPEEATPLRAGVLGAAAIVSFHDPQAAWTLLGQAEEVADATGDDRALLHVALAELNLLVLLEPLGGRPAERAIRVSDRVERLARMVHDAGAFDDALFFRAEVAMRLGDLATVNRAVQMLRDAPLGATALGQIMASMHQAALDGLRGDAASMRQALGPARRLAPAIDVTASPVAMSDILHRYLIGRDEPTLLLEELDGFLRSLEANHPGGTTWTGGLMLAMLAAEAGTDAPARAVVPDASLLRTVPLAACFASLFVVNVAALTGRSDDAEATYGFLAPAAGQLMYFGGMWTVCGSGDHLLGRCAATAGRLGDAARHYRDALAVEGRVGAPHLLARTHLRLAELGAAVHDRALTEEHVRSALALCDQHGLTYLRSCVAALREPEATADAGPNRLTCEGQVWAITFEGRTVRLRDAKGMHVLATLLSNPGREFHALDLAGATHLAGADGELPIMDERAKDAYRHRLTDLADDLEDARRDNDLERATRAEQEIDAITEQLTTAVGLGGRNRRAASQSERARVAATRNLRSVIHRAAAAHPSLGRHLELTVRTGTYCSYQPDPRLPTAWRVDRLDTD